MSQHMNFGLFPTALTKIGVLRNDIKALFKRPLSLFFSNNCCTGAYNRRANWDKSLRMLEWGWSGTRISRAWILWKVHIRVIKKLGKYFPKLFYINQPLFHHSAFIMRSAMKNLHRLFMLIIIKKICRTSKWYTADVFCLILNNYVNSIMLNELSQLIFNVSQRVLM